MKVEGEEGGGTYSKMVAANWMLLFSATHCQHCKFSSDTQTFLQERPSVAR